ncbi:MAG: hypothetical protein ABI639_06365 [Thermoanaerobaculia bacterium]
MAPMALIAAPLLAQPDVGLSSVHAQRFVNEAIGSFPAGNFEYFGRVLVAGDFNGDGADDLATAIPEDDGIPGIGPAGAGAVSIRYGNPAAAGGGLLSGPPAQFLRKSPLFDVPQAGDHFGAALASCDFDGDGRDDLAIGVPDDNFPSAVDAGAVEIHYGSPSGLQSDAAAFLTEETPGVPSLPTTDDQFGFALTCGDWNGDGFADLAIGAPGEAVGGGTTDAGMVIVIHGSASGLDPVASYPIHQDIQNVPGTAESGDRFGAALVSGNFDGDGFDDLAIGVPGESAGSLAGAGCINVLFGTSLGLTATGSTLYLEDSLGSFSEVGDNFGFALAAGNFDGDGFDDLAIGVPGEDAGGSILEMGQVVVMYGSAADFNLPRTRFLDQDGVLGVGTNEAGDRFGAALAAADFNGDGRADLAIGQPGEFVLSSGDGAVTVVLGGDGGLVLGHHRGIAGGFEGIPGNNQQGLRNFGDALAAGDFDGDGHADLAIGVPGEDLPGLADSGTEVILYGSLFADGFESASGAYWSAVLP